MKIINYRQNTAQFDCVIHGRILITPDEHKQIIKLIKSMTKGKDYEIYYPWIPSLALEDISHMKHNRYNVRVKVTNYLVDKMPHTGNIKIGNYYFEIIGGNI